jgi:hypothetical protein
MYEYILIIQNIFGSLFKHNIVEDLPQGLPLLDRLPRSVLPGDRTQILLIRSLGALTKELASPLRLKDLGRFLYNMSIIYPLLYILINHFNSFSFDRKDA